MPVALLGALVGLAIAVILIVVEVISVNKRTKELAEARHLKKMDTEPEDRIRVRQIITFSFFIPPAFALFAWLLWG